MNSPGRGDLDSRGIPKEIAGQVTDFTSVGTAPGKRGLEKIVAVHPDLIVGVNGKRGIANLAQLEASAGPLTQLSAIPMLAQAIEKAGGPH